MQDTVAMIGGFLRDLDYVIMPRTVLEAYRKIADHVRNERYYEASKVVDIVDDLGMD